MEVFESDQMQFLYKKYGCLTPPS